jgi:8-oxo-dGTP pyrophosphatase MutT (NUDIX family)
MRRVRVVIQGQVQGVSFRSSVKAQADSFGDKGTVENVGKDVVAVFEGEIYVGMRGTEPHKGKYGAIGGKQDPRTTDARFESRIVKPGGIAVHSIMDTLALESGMEFLGDTAARELIEETFRDRVYDRDVGGLVSDVYKLGLVSDTFGHRRFDCYFFLATITSNRFSLSPREISEIRPLRGIDPEKIIPMSRIALEQVRYLGELGMFEHLAEVYASLDVSQIPTFSRMPSMEHTMMGATMHSYDARNLVL